VRENNTPRSVRIERRISKLNDDLLYPENPDRTFYCDLYDKIKDIKTD
jgi:hypothetical protein